MDTFSDCLIEIENYQLKNTEFQDTLALAAKFLSINPDLI